MFSHSAWHKKRFAENAEYREKIRAARRRYRETHKDEMQRAPPCSGGAPTAPFATSERASGREWERRKRYGEVYRISVADYDAMRKRQNGACAICKRSGQALCVDHCHACGKVRGLLCGKCNSVLGFCGDSPRASAGGRRVPAGVVRSRAGKFHDGRSSRNRPVARGRGWASLSLRRQSPISPSVADLTFLSALPRVIS